MPDNFVELDRTFHELSLGGGDDDELDYRRLWSGEKLGWSSLLEEYRTILLSEAGSGKTEEIRHAAQQLRSEGKPAFFLRLEHVAADMDISFEEGTIDEFKAWLGSDEEGWLFLDSVDEARLREPLDFERAVRTIGSRISTALQRVHVVLSGRGTAWRPVTDLALCEKHLRFVRPETANEARDSKRRGTDARSKMFKVVALDDLREPQIERFANSRGVQSPKSFLHEIEKADA